MDAQLTAMVDTLIGQKDGAVKYTPIVEDMFRDELAKLRVKPEDVATITPQVVATVKARQAEIQALADTEHAKFVAQLRAEIQSDPDSRGYAGMTAAQIAAEMQREIPIEVDQPIQTEMAELVDTVLASLIKRPEGIAISADGRVLTDGHSGLQAEIDAAVAKSGKPVDELTAPRTQRVVVGAKSAPCWRVIGGVKYGRNVVRVEEIVEALA